MTTGLLLLSSTLIATFFFVKIGLRPLSLIPIGFFLLFISNIRIEKKEESQRDVQHLIKQYGLLISRAITMVGLWGVLHYLGIDAPTIFHVLIGINIVLTIGSLLYHYRDGHQVFHRAIWLTLIALRGWTYRQHGPIVMREMMRLHITTLTAVYAFIYFIVGNFVSIPTSFKEILSILSHTTIIILLLRTSSNTYHGLFIAQVYITLIYSIIYYIHQRPQLTKTVQGVTLQDILSGERILGKNLHTTHSTITPRRVNSIQSHLSGLSPYTKATLSILNIIIVIAMMIWFALHMRHHSDILIRELLYRLSIILFIVNFIIIKKVDFYYKIQRVFVFFIINFAIYLSLLNISHLLNWNDSSIALIATCRNIANSVAIFYSRDMYHQSNIKKADYYYRTVANIIAMIINIVLIARLDIANQLKFALITIYIGVQGYLMYYNLLYIHKIEEEKQSIQNTKNDIIDSQSTE